MGYIPKTIGDIRYDTTLYCDSIGSMQRKSAPLDWAHQGVCFVPMKAFDGIKELLFSEKAKYGFRVLKTVQKHQMNNPKQFLIKTSIIKGYLSLDGF